MKLFRRYFSVLLCVLLLSIVFSLNASAESVDTSSYKINIYAYGGANDNGLVQVDINQGEKGSKTGDYRTIQSSGGKLTIKHRYTIVDNNTTALLKKGGVYKFSVSNIIFENGVGAIDRINEPHLMHIRLIYSDNSSIDISPSNANYTFEFNQNSELYNFTADLGEIKKDVYRIQFWIQQQWTTSSSVSANSVVGAFPLDIKIEKQSEEAGLLGGLIGWVKNIFDKIGGIFDKITDGFSNMASGFLNVVNKLTEGFSNIVSNLVEGFKNMVDTLIELPSKLWQLISDGLKALFVPDSEYIQEYKNSWNTLLSNRFGAIYDVFDIIINFFDDLTADGDVFDYYIDVPEVSLDSVGIPFTFGGWTVRVVPEGFDFLADTIDYVICVIATFMFLNAMRKRYDDVIGG